MLVLIGICLPVPLLAGTGLSIPLPGTVERIAAALVSWIDGPLGGDEALAARNGSIVLAPGEPALSAAAPDETANPPRRLVVAITPNSGETGAGGDGSSTSKNDSGGSGGTGGSSGGDGSGGGGGGGGSSGGDEPEDDPEDDPDLVEDTVEELDETTDPIVEEVEETANDLLEVGDALLGLGD